MQDHTDDTTSTRACPPWCTRDHEAGLHPDDQHHLSRACRVAVVSGDPALEPDDQAVADAVVARLLRRSRSDLTWLEVVSEEGRDVRLVTTVESAGRLLAVLRRLLADAGE
jgi:hypothetical protein